MPRADVATVGKFVKLLLIGDGKIGKSHYAGLAAEQGFNVLYLDGDVASPTITGLPQKAKENIYLVNVGDRLVNGSTQHRFADFMKSFFGTIKVLWNDSDSELLDKKTYDGQDVWEILPSAFDKNWVIVIDSWTSLVQSVMLWAAKSHGVDLSDTNTPSMRPVYQSAGNKLTQFLSIIQQMQTNVICIAHPDEYTKLERPEGLKLRDIKETDMRIAWTKLIPKSSSKPHSLQMAKFFTDVAWMEASKSGRDRLINFKISDERISGGHFDDKKPMEEYTFEALMRKVGGFVPDAHAPIEPMLMIHSDGSFELPGSAKVLNSGASNSKDSGRADPDASKPQPIRGLAAMMAKQAKA